MKLTSEEQRVLLRQLFRELLPMLSSEECERLKHKLNTVNRSTSECTDTIRNPSHVSPYPLYLPPSISPPPIIPPLTSHHTPPLTPPLTPSCHY